MKTRALARIMALVVAAASIALGGVAAADDDPLAPPPAEEGAPPPPAGKDEPKPEADEPDAGPADAPAEKPVEPTPEPKPTPKGDAWGTPDASPTRRVADDLLPPPLIRNPATGATTGGSRATTARGAPDTPATTPPLTPLPVLPDDGVDPALVPGVPKAPAAAPVTAVAPAGATIRTLAKMHNQKLADGTPALRLDIEFETSGQQGRRLFLAAAFSRTDTNATIRSLLPAYAGRSGNIVARTEPVRVQTDGRYRASVWVPYGAFPAPEAGSTYDVRALVQLLRRESGGGETVLSHQRTTFTVHGPAR